MPRSEYMSQPSWRLHVRPLLGGENYTASSISSERGTEDPHLLNIAMSKTMTLRCKTPTKAVKNVFEMLEIPVERRMLTVSLTNILTTRLFVGWLKWKISSWPQEEAKSIGLDRLLPFLTTVGRHMPWVTFGFKMTTTQLLRNVYVEEMADHDFRQTTQDRRAWNYLLSKWHHRQFYSESPSNLSLS